MFREKGYIPESETEKPKKPEGQEVSRRDFLKIAATAFGTLALSNEAKAGIASISSESLSDQIIIKESKNENEVTVVPEYQRVMDKILISIPNTNKEGEKKESDDISEVTPYLKNLYNDLLKNLPKYTQIEIIVSPADRLRTEKMIAEMGLADRANYHQASDDSGMIEAWAQDLGEAVSVNGEEKFIVPLTAITKENPATNKRITSRRKLIEQTFGKQGVLEAPFFFEGGNVTFDQTEDGLRIFIGYDDLIDTQYYYQQKKDEKTISEIAKMISKQFGGAEVVVMGNGFQSEFMPHIDQSFIILADKKAALNKIDDNSDAAKKLRFQQSQLEALGYQVKNIDITQNDLDNSYSSVNAIPFVDKITGEKKIIFPVFPTEVNGDFKNSQAIAEKDLKEKGLQAFKTYQQLGYKPIPVRDFSHVIKGNVHCISNVLARQDNKSSSEIFA